MRTTIDIPDDLLRRTKALAALRGLKLKDFVAEALRGALGEPRSARTPEPAAASADRVALAADCVFPLVRGPGGPALQDLTPERLAKLLEDEDVARALLPR
jgi:Arc/MetJ family transcription regulator